METIRYGTESHQVGDLYRPPAGEGPRRDGPDGPGSNRRSAEPAVVLLHGGGWAALDRSSVNGVALELCDAGHTVLNVEYRLATHGNVDQTLADCVLAARWLERPVMLVGLSAGGHLALCAARALRADAVGVVGIGAPTLVAENLPSSIDVFSHEHLVRVFGTAGRDGELPISDDLQPVELARTGCLPPTALIHNRNDTVVGVDHARLLRDAGGKGIELHLFDGEANGHGIWVEAGPPLETRRLVPEVAEPLMGVLARWRRSILFADGTVARSHGEESSFMTTKTVDDIVKRVASRVIEEHQVHGGYTLDLTLSAMLEWGEVTGDREYHDYVFSIIDERGWNSDTLIPYETQPFCHINYTLYQISEDGAFGEAFVKESRRFFEEVPRSEDGLVLLRDKNVPRNNVIIDFMQDYASRMAQTAGITGEELFYRECVEQFRLHRNVLRDPETGLWSTGRGWIDADPRENSPGRWSRGHGWLLRGLVESLSALPADSAYAAELQGYLNEVADALLEVQDDKGMWHQLLGRPYDRSYPDTSGTGLIAYYLCKATAEGHLDDERYRVSALLASRGLSANVAEDGSVQHVCPGPGPLRSEEDYFDNPGETEHHSGHGTMAVLFACTGVRRVLNPRPPERGPRRPGW